MLRQPLVILNLPITSKCKYHHSSAKVIYRRTVGGFSAVWKRCVKTFREVAPRAPRKEGDTYD